MIGNCLDKEKIFKKLYQIYSRCSSSKWDGNKANPIRNTTFAKAQIFLASLPIEIKPDNIKPNIDGNIIFEWKRSDNKMILISISYDGAITYDMIIGENKSNGVSVVQNTISGDLLKLIKQVIE